jgi:Ala-tRNA(Pro) deacylase
MTVETFLQIKKILEDNKIEYTHLTHEHVHRSEDAAKIRGTNLDEAAKAIVLKVEKKKNAVGEGIADVKSEKYYEFIQIVIGGDQRIDLKKLRTMFDSKNVALASPDEVLEKTGCTIGSVPPFGILFSIPVYLDKSLLDKPRIVFSAGTHNDSIMMNPEDYFRIINPVVDDFKK